MTARGLSSVLAASELTLHLNKIVATFLLMYERLMT